MLVLLSAPGSPAGRDHLWKPQERLLDAATQGVALLQADSRNADDADGESPLVEGRQEAAIQERKRSQRHEKKRHTRCYDDRAPLERPVEHLSVDGLQPPEERRLALEDPRLRQQHIAERRRDGHRDEERSCKPRDVSEPEGPQQPTFETRQQEKRNKDENDDERREEDCAAHLGGGLKNDLERRPALFFG